MFSVRLDPCLCTAPAQQSGFGLRALGQIVQRSFSSRDCGEEHRRRSQREAGRQTWDLSVVILWIFKIAFTKKYNCDRYSFEDGSWHRAGHQWFYSITCQTVAFSSHTYLHLEIHYLITLLWSAGVFLKHGELCKKLILKTCESYWLPYQWKRGLGFHHLWLFLFFSMYRKLCEYLKLCLNKCYVWWVN